MSETNLLMYSMEPEDYEEKKAPRVHVQHELGPKKVRPVYVGAIKYDVPAVDWVAVMEVRLERQERLIAEQARELKRMERIISNLKTASRQQAAISSNISRELDNKIDRHRGGE